MQHLRDLLDDDQGEGFAVLTTALLLDHHGFDDGLKAITAVLSWVATPLKVYDNEPLWSRLNVDPEDAAGEKPLHIDAIRWRLLRDGVCEGLVAAMAWAASSFRPGLSAPMPGHRPTLCPSGARRGVPVRPGGG